MGNDKFSKEGEQKRSSFASLVAFFRSTSIYLPPLKKGDEGGFLVTFLFTLHFTVRNDPPSL